MPVWQVLLCCSLRALETADGQSQSFFLWRAELVREQRPLSKHCPSHAANCFGEIMGVFKRRSVPEDDLRMDEMFRRGWGPGLQASQRQGVLLPPYE